jgi:hypothetical protein
LKLLAAHDLSGALDQQLENPARLAGQPDFEPLFPELARPRVELERTEAQNSSGCGFHKGG